MQPPKRNVRMANAEHQLEWDVGEQYFPETLADLKTIVNAARAAGRRVRAHGTLHSFSDIARCSDVAVSNRQLNRLLAIDPANLRPGETPNAYRSAESGIVLRDLNAALDRQNKALPTMGGYNGLTLGGVVNGGTQGSNIGIGNVASMVVAFVLVKADGTAVLIQPAAGPYKTRAEGFRAPGIDDVVRDDDTFYAALVGLGCFGLVYAYTVRVRDAFVLDEVRTRTTWSELRPRLANQSFFLPPAQRDWGHPYQEIYVNPHKTKQPGTGAQDHSCLVTHRTIVQNAPSVPPSGLSRPYWFDITRGFANVIPGFARFVINHGPAGTPGQIDMVFDWMKDRHFVARSYDVLSGGETLGGIGIAIVLPMRGTAWLEGVERVFEIAAAEAEADRYLSMISLRFVKRSRAWMAAQYAADDTPMCMLEILTIAGVGGTLVSYEKVDAALFAFGGRPHWGLHFIESTAIARHMNTDTYPRLDAWKKAFARFNGDPPMFAGAFTDRVGVTP